MSITKQLVLELVEIPVNLIVPETSRVYKGLLWPIPTLLFFNTKSPLPYCPITTLSSAKTSTTGSPALLFTDIKESLRSSTTENNVPFVPSARINVAPAVVEFT